mmetsp:Transcript_18925/g.42298  ORF Transcript_18925/g.42298 Transcript_18925/m.42298 type:complete len:260 (-) Transcript_18925:2039-2818(-)
MSGHMRDCCSVENPSSWADRESETRIIEEEIRSERIGSATSGWRADSVKRRFASSLASSRSLSRTCSTYVSLIERNSSTDKLMLATISIEEQMTPHLFAEESFTMGRRAASKSACRASAVRKRFAPSTMRREEGVPSGNSISFQLEAFTVEGRPPAGTRASERTRECIELRFAAPSAVSAEKSCPCGLRRDLSSSISGKLECTSLRSSSIGSPCGSSADPLPSAIPTTRTIAPYSRSRILSMLPATSPSGPPVSLTVQG